jgi:hypothetical protein
MGAAPTMEGHDEHAMTTATNARDPEKSIANLLVYSVTDVR